LEGKGTGLPASPNGNQSQNHPAELQCVASSAHQYPVTKLLYCPNNNGHGNGGGGPELLATTGDYFRIWESVSSDIGNEQLLICRATLQNVRRVGQVA
jgi:hypothetical protein